jgi:hypothetical protein
MKLLKIFLCHSSSDKAEVKKLYDFLRKNGTEPWLDSEDLLPGQNWNMEIMKALDSSDVILLCLSKKSVDKEGYVQKEIRLALDRALEMPDGRIFLIPVKLEKCEVPFSLKEYQWVELFEDGGMEKLVKGLNARATQVKARSISVDGSLPEVKKSAPERKPRPKPKSSNTTINVYGNVSGSNLVVGDGNEVNNED